MAEKEIGPDNPSADYTAMLPYWKMVSDILGGAPTMRKAGQTYLPQFPHESGPDYNHRCANAPFTNIYGDIVENLAAKPFAKEAGLVDRAGQSFVDLAEDIDGRGNNLNVFLGHWFFAGINDAVSFVLVDKKAVPPGASIAEENALGARPYWVHIPAIAMIAAYSDVIDGKEQFIHCRFLEPYTVREGWAEVTKPRVRVLDRPKIGEGKYGPATWELFEEQTDASGNKTWVSIEGGPISIGVIALVPFITGRRKPGTWQFVPSMNDAAYLQIEHYQQETGLKYASENTAFPMLAGNGVSPELDEKGNVKPAPVGPKTVLYAPPSSDGSQHGAWTFIEPSAESLRFLQARLEGTAKELRELGRQPLTASSGNLTVVTTAFAAQKGNSAAQTWALNLKDAAELAFVYTGLWLNQPTAPEVYVFTDFSVEMESDKGPDFLLKLRERGDISRKAITDEGKRRGFLSGDYDAEKDMELILKEAPADDLEDEIEPASSGVE